MAPIRYIQVINVRRSKKSEKSLKWEISLLYETLKRLVTFKLGDWWVPDLVQNLTGFLAQHTHTHTDRR